MPCPSVPRRALDRRCRPLCCHTQLQHNRVASAFRQRKTLPRFSEADVFVNFKSNNAFFSFQCSTSTWVSRMTTLAVHATLWFDFAVSGSVFVGGTLSTWDLTSASLWAVAVSICFPFYTWPSNLLLSCSLLRLWNKAVFFFFVPNKISCSGQRWVELSWYSCNS